MTKTVKTNIAKVINESEIVNIIRTSAIKHGIDPDYLVEVARCESTLKPNSINYNYYAGGGHPTGLFQYLPETWNRIGSRSPYGVGDISNALRPSEPNGVGIR